VGNTGILQGDGPFHEWWYGPTGTGKSKSVWELYPNHYGKQLNKWWDGYEGEDVVVIEEWSPKNEVTGSFLKIWADRYPFNAEIKGATLKKIRPKKIIVTSNYTIEECFPTMQDCEPLKRRFKTVYFPQIFVPRGPLPTTDQLLNEMLSFS
jgi:RNA helicase.